MSQIAEALDVEKDAAYKRWHRDGRYPQIVKVDSSGFYEWRER